jgi:pimeloyl-ACP methyl ester carboxylesterase
MPTFEREGVSIAYDEYGSGFPILMIAGGGMHSAAAFWTLCPWDLIAQLGDEYRLIVMDQRNAGRSSGPVSADDGWHTYCNDQIALMDHLGIARFHVAGMCIAGAFIMGLIDVAPERIVSAVVIQPIGRHNNQVESDAHFDEWRDQIRGDHPQMTDADWLSFRTNIMGGDKFLFTVDHDWVEECQTPMIVLMGQDLAHPESSSRELAATAVNATLIEDWKGEEHHSAAQAAVADFLIAHSPE